MKIVNLRENYDKVVELTAEIIKMGGLVVFPSDSVYGLAVDPQNQKAVDKLLAFKERWPGKAISIAVADENMANDFVEIDDKAKAVFKNILPGPFTIIVNGKHKMAKGVEAENGTLGIRIPDYKFINDLVKKLNGPITATSANLSGRTPHYSVESFLKTLSFKKKKIIDLIVDAGKLSRNLPSTVIDLSSGNIEVLRRGEMLIGKSKTLISKSEKDTEKIAIFLLKKFFKSKTKPLVFGLSGELGCGKTVFSRAIGRYLGVREKITSPTFVIMNEYKIRDKLSVNSEQINKFLHFDLYRLKEDFEFEEINFINQFLPDSVSCIEWPEIMGKTKLDKLKKKVEYIPVNFGYEDETTRSITF